MVFVNKIVIVNDPYGFRLLVMGSDDCMKMIESDAFKVFMEFDKPDVVLWTSMVSGFEQNGCFKGIEKIRDRNIVLESKYGFPEIVTGDVTVAEEVELEDIVENIGAKLVRETTAKTNELPGLNAEDVNREVSAAHKAFDKRPWPKMIAYERSHIMLRFADLLEKHTAKVAAFETWDTGKHYEQAANTEIPMVVRMFRYYASWADKIHGLTIPADGQHHVQTLHEPYGVTGLIIPWNFPLLLYSWKVGPALACGNTVVLKTIEQTPLSALYVSKLFHEAGLPPSALNVVSGFGLTVGAALFSHMDVNKLSFTGSTGTDKIVLGLAAKSNFKPVTLELGRKFPFIVCKDADVDKAVELACSALFFNQGQCCCADLCTLVHKSVYDEFVEKAKARVLKRVVGDPLKKGIEQGPQIHNEQLQKILKYVRFGIESGATVEFGGEQLGSKGYYIQPTVFSNVQADMLIVKDKILGPVPSISKFKDFEVDIAFQIFQIIWNFNLRSDSIILVNILSSCIKVGTLKYGKEIHAYAIRNGLRTTIIVGNSLLYMHYKCGSLQLGVSIFNPTVDVTIADCEEISEGDLINNMITGTFWADCASFIIDSTIGGLKDGIFKDESAKKAANFTLQVINKNKPDQVGNGYAYVLNCQTAHIAIKVFLGMFVRQCCLHTLILEDKDGF
ncbi:hypothetical protein CRYUN_Cryun11dG0110800 [Craigia yunnanensis]